MILFLIRHGNTDAVGKAISGRAKGVFLNEQGERQARLLAAGLAKRRIDAIICSPLERARQTAEPLARKLKLPLKIDEGLNDIEFGDWTGGLLSELQKVEKWRRWNQFRGSVRIPNGETIIEVQARMLAQVERIRADFPDGRVAVVSHADPIRTVLAHFLGTPLDLLDRLEISPASVSTLDINDWGVRLQELNATFSSEAVE